MEHTEDLYAQYAEHLPAALGKIEDVMKAVPAILPYLQECERMAEAQKRRDTEDDERDYSLRGLLREPLHISAKYMAHVQGML